MDDETIEADIAALKQTLYSEGRALPYLLLRRMAILMRERCGVPPQPTPRKSTAPNPIAGWGR